MKYKFLGSTADLAQQMPWRCGAQRSDVVASPQGECDACVSLGASAVDSGGAFEECLLCSPDKGRPAAWAT